MSRQTEISDKSTRNDPNKQEDAKSITVINHPVTTPAPSPTSAPCPVPTSRPICEHIWGVGALARRDESLYGTQRGPDSDDSSSSKMMLFRAGNTSAALGCPYSCSTGVPHPQFHRNMQRLHGGKLVEEIDPFTLYRVFQMGFLRTALANVEPIHAGEEAQKPVHQGGKLPIRLTARGLHSRVSGTRG